MDDDFDGNIEDVHQENGKNEEQERQDDYCCDVSYNY